jgi:hypothetical protein
MTDTQPPAQPPTQTPKKPKLPLDFVMLKLHEAMEMLFAYDHDPNFVPSADQLLLIEMLHKQITGYAAMSIIIVETMRQRVDEALSATAPGDPKML